MAIVMRPRRLWFDTEFIEDGRTIDLMSIGIVRDDGEEYYAESAECDLSRASEWVKENVVPHLRGGAWLKPRKQIAGEIVRFVGPKPEFWAYYSSYDWVTLCQLYGTMMDLPEGWPKMCMDIKQEANRLGLRTQDLPVKPTNAHDAIADARWNREAWDLLREYGKGL
jgi:hypothetical protein